MAQQVLNSAGSNANLHIDYDLAMLSWAAATEYAAAAQIDPNNPYADPAAMDELGETNAFCSGVMAVAWNDLSNGGHTPSASSSPSAPSSITITSFVVTPLNPTAYENVTATATISGAPANTPVTLSDQGTDGYTDSNTVNITGTGTVTLDIPGGAQGVQDTITLTVPGLAPQEKQVVYG